MSTHTPGPWACDLLPTEALGPHWQGDVRDVLGWGWDLMIAHPPCTHLAVSGAKWFHRKQAEARAMRAMLVERAPAYGWTDTRDVDDSDWFRMLHLAVAQPVKN